MIPERRTLNEFQPSFVKLHDGENGGKNIFSESITQYINEISTEIR